MLKIFARYFLSCSALTLSLSFFAAAGFAASADCADADGYGFVCGPENAEDLVLVAGTSWIIASGDLPNAAIYLINAAEKSWSGLYPGANPRHQHNMNRYPLCPGAPDLSNFVTHGLNIRAGNNGHSTLYAVSHGAREAIEVFDVDATGSQPALTWVGCVLMPEGLDANSVASFSDGTIVATVLIQPDKTFHEAISGKPTGGVYEWKVGDAGFALIAGTELPANNGIEVSADGSEIYVASSGLHTVVAFSHTYPARQLRTTGELAFTPDNVHMDSNGKLVTAGMLNEDPVCGTMSNPDTFDLAVIRTCPRPFMATVIDPATMAVSELSSGPATPAFSNSTMAVQVGNEVWIGTFSGQRVAYRTIK